MSDPFPLVASGAVGAVLGLVFFGGLWLTVAGLATARHPARRLLVSLLVRIAIVTAGFVMLLMQSGWLHGLCALAGFVVARSAVIAYRSPVDNAGADR